MAWVVTLFMSNSHFKFVKLEIKRVDRNAAKFLIELHLVCGHARTEVFDVPPLEAGLSYRDF